MEYFMSLDECTILTVKHFDNQLIYSYDTEQNSASKDC